MANCKLMLTSELSLAVLSQWRKMGEGMCAFLTSSPEWHLFLSRQMGCDPLVSVAYGPSGAACAILPLLKRVWCRSYSIRGRLFAALKLNVLKVCGGDFVGDVSVWESTAYQLACILKSKTASAIYFDNLNIRNSLYSERAKEILRKHGLMWIPVSRILPHYRLRMPTTSDALWSMRKNKTLSKIEGRIRAVERDYNNRIMLLEIDSLVKWRENATSVIDLMNNTWQASRLGHLFDGASCEEMARNGWLRGFGLRLGDRLIAYAECYQGYGTLVYERIGYDPEFAKYSPGSILLVRLLARLYEKNCPDIVDFGEGDADYKRNWSNEREDVFLAMLVRTCTWGAFGLKILMLLERAFERISRKLPH